MVVAYAIEGSSDLKPFTYLYPTGEHETDISENNKDMNVKNIKKKIEKNHIDVKSFIYMTNKDIESILLMDNYDNKKKPSKEIYTIINAKLTKKLNGIKDYENNMQMYKNSQENKDPKQKISLKDIGKAHFIKKRYK